MSADSSLPAPVDEIESSDTGAPLVLLTGMPGAGKTLYALAEFAVGKRDVYQANIPGCKLPSFDPKNWAALLDTIAVDATLLFDEAREIFPPKSPTADPPPWYVLNRIRHTGRRGVIITQHPSDIDARVRRLCSRHIHLVEAFGGGAASTYEWKGKIGDVDSQSSREDSLRGKFAYPKSVFKLYKSTLLHRGTTKKPLKVRLIPYLFALAGIMMLGAGWYTYAFYTKSGKVDTARPGAGAVGGGITAKSAPGRQGGDRVPLTAAEYVASYQPRIDGLVYTATRYDKQSEPVRAPYPAACAVTPSRACRCYSQQATVLVVPVSLCQQIVDRGYFLDFSPESVPAQPTGGALPGTPPVAAPVSLGPAQAVALATPLPGAGLIVIGHTRQVASPQVTPGAPIDNGPPTGRAPGAAAR